MSGKDEKPALPAGSDAEKSSADQLQEQIDALVRGEGPKGSRSLRDLAKKPNTGAGNPQKRENQRILDAGNGLRGRPVRIPLVQ